MGEDGLSGEAKSKHLVCGVVDTENEKVQHFCSPLTLYLMINFVWLKSLDSSFQLLWKERCAGLQSLEEASFSAEIIDVDNIIYLDDE